MIQVENLNKHYGDLTAIKNLSFNVNKGVVQ
jgi:ABC-type multidrug transport system ATPase subunit